MVYFRCTSSGSGKGNTVIVTCAEQFAGVAITIAKIGKSYTKVCPLSAPYVVKFYGVEAGTYTVSATVSGQTYSAEVVVQDVSCVLNYGFNWKIWVDTASQLDSTDYASLSEVLVDEEAVRELFTEHSCVDYMADSGSSNADLETIIDNDLCAKWINNRDYALDYLGANVVIKALMDTADKYGYGEWVVVDDTTTPPTYGPKGNVPVMTANNAPYGEAIGSTSASGNNAAFHAFNGDETENGASMDGANAWIGYSFTNPICVKRVYIHPYPRRMGNYRIEGSNDGSTWTPITEYVTTSDDGSAITANINNETYYLKLRVHSTTNADNSNMTIREIQFYGRSLSVSVPTMTSNTTPYGEVIYSSQNSSYPAYQAFNGNTANSWGPSDATVPQWIGYKFKQPTCVRTVIIRPDANSNGSSIKDFKVQGSNDGFASDIHDIYTGSCTNATSEIDQIFTFDNDEYYLYYRVYITSKQSGWSGGASTSKVQFYAPDYSEKEFANDGSKWLYDHGVELEEIIGNNTSLYYGTLEKLDSVLRVTASATMPGGYYRYGVRTKNTIDLTAFSLYRTKIVNSDFGKSSDTHIGMGISDDGSGTYDAWTDITATQLPNNAGLDISAVNGNNYIQDDVIKYANDNVAYYMDVAELWLE